ncbi:MAG: hypothetical protein IJO42_02775 [Clostridia bacterium]|nr:hypothetical protein [Clostridia bacterium]
MAQTNRAYDLELFQPREARLVALKNNKKVQEATRRRTRRQSVLNVVVYLVLGLLVMGAVGFFITGRVVLTEMKQELADQMKYSEALDSESVRLDSELAALTGAEQVNLYAQENGLVPVGSNQIYYIESQEQDQVSLPSENDSWFRKAWIAIQDFLS